MKCVLKYFLFSVIIFSLCINFTAQQLKKEILFKHYDPVVYDFPAQILSIAEDSLGIKYFGTTSGIFWDHFGNTSGAILEQGQF